MEVTKTYPEGGVSAPVLRGVSFELPRGATMSLIGESGSGKSTLLGLIAGLLRPDSGSIAFDGADITQLDDAGWARLRARRIGVVVQQGNLIPYLTAKENVELAIRLAGIRGHHRVRAGALLAELGLADRTDQLPRNMSGGEVQRVALAMALVNDPELLLADEMTGELDSATADQVMNLVFRLWQERALTVLYVTHSAELADRAQTRMVLGRGRVRTLGPVRR